MFKNFSDIGRANYIDPLQQNLIAYLDWNFINKGGFWNREVGSPYSSGIYGGDYTVLRPAYQWGYESGQIWEAAHTNFVWETGLSYDYQPIQISGVFVDSVFHASGSDHHINFELGRIVFDTPIDTGSQVVLEYSDKWIQVAHDDQPYFTDLLYGRFDVSNENFLKGSGESWGIYSNRGVQLPCVITEMVGQQPAIGSQLGGGRTVEQDVLLHVFAETSWMRNNLTSALYNQEHSAFLTFNVNEMTDSGAFPIDYRGMITDNALTLPDLINNYLWKNVYIKRASVQNLDSRVSLPLYRAVVRYTLEYDI